MAQSNAQPDRPLHVLYCRCAYAKVVPEDVKDRVLERLCESGRPFDTVADLCEMSARRDPALKKIAERGEVKIIACYERAVRGLFHAAGAPLPPPEGTSEGVTVLNMRVMSGDEAADAALADMPREEARA